MKAKTKLKYCVTGNTLLLVVIVIIITHYQHESKYFRFGPSNDLIVISVNINTNNRYLILLLIISLVKITKVVVEEIGMPVIGFSIYNPDKKVITEFTKNELQFYGNTMYLTSSLRYIFEVMVTITQIDIAIYSVIISEITTLFTIRLLLNEKRFSKNEDDSMQELLNIVDN
tara:strand:+ start:67 stop:582 length:516 start_codon:yes stop_codon:yes gene_type:complete